MPNYTEPSKTNPTITEPPKTDVTYTEEQWIVLFLARWIDIAGLTWADLDEITWAGLDATHGNRSHKVTAPDYTELEKSAIIIAEPEKTAPTYTEPPKGD